MEKALPPIPPKRYFTIGEVSDLCRVKPYVLRYWEQEFTQLKPMKRRGNRRYYQHHEVLLIRRIRDLLYEQGFTISGARNRLADGAAAQRAGELDRDDPPEDPVDEVDADLLDETDGLQVRSSPTRSAKADGGAASPQEHDGRPIDLMSLRVELQSIRRLLDS